LNEQVSIVLSTYEQPRCLELALLGYARQTLSDFEVVVARTMVRVRRRQA